MFHAKIHSSKNDCICSKSQRFELNTFQENDFRSLNISFFYRIPKVNKTKFDKRVVEFIVIMVVCLTKKFRRAALVQIN